MPVPVRGLRDVVALFCVDDDDDDDDDDDRQERPETGMRVGSEFFQSPGCRLGRGGRRC